MLGAHASRRAGFGVAPKRTFLFSQRKVERVSRKVRDREDALASTWAARFPELVARSC